MDAKAEILKLEDGERWVWPESDYGLAEIKREGHVYVLFEIPQFGGEPIFVEEFTITTIPYLIKQVESWT